MRMVEENITTVNTAVNAEVAPLEAELETENEKTLATAMAAAVATAVPAAVAELYRRAAELDAATVWRESGGWVGVVVVKIGSIVCKCVRYVIQYVML